MAKKTKSTRRSRAKKEAAGKKQTTPVAEEAVITTEGSNEPVVKETKKTPAKKATSKKPTTKKTDERPIETAVAAEAEHLETIHSVEEMVRPQRNRMIMGASILLLVIVVAVAGAFALKKHTTTASDTNQSMVQSGKTPTDPDKLLESGGKVCTNGNTTPNTQASSNPNSVGMMLQSVPANNIQTPQTVSSSNDAATLQGAACF